MILIKLHILSTSNNKWDIVRVILWPTVYILIAFA